MEYEKVICITCPKGCTLEVEREGDTIIKVRQGCKRGHEYARAELVDPRRMVASSVRIHGSTHPLLPVYTSAPFPKPRIRELMDTLRALEIEAPVQMEDVVIENALDTGINIISSRNMPRVR